MRLATSLAVVQAYWVLRHGIYPAQRREDDGGVNLYRCIGDGHSFFVEVSSDDGRGQAVVLRNFLEAGLLERRPGK